MSVTVLADVLKSAAARLATALHLEPREARLEAQILAAHALGVNRAWLIAHDRDELSVVQTSLIETLYTRREQGEPVAYILGEKEFYGHPFKVTPDVLIPRPDTELLVETALERLPKDRPARILDLGTGSGCIAISLALERPESTVIGIDASKEALNIAQENARNLRASNTQFIQSNWYSALSGESFDMIVANPPYIPTKDPHLAIGDLPFEPLPALAAGPDGLVDIRHIVAEAPQHLLPNGWLLLEHGFDQGEASRNIFSSAGMVLVDTCKDMAGLPRVTIGQSRTPA